MNVYYLTFNVPYFNSYHRVEAPTLAIAKKKFLKGTLFRESQVKQLKRVSNDERRKVIPKGKR